MVRILAIISLSVFVLKQAHAAIPPCPGGNTLEINACLGIDLDHANEQLQRYTDAALERLRKEDDAAEAETSFREGEAAWARYRDAECGAVYDSWLSGSIRNIEALVCEKRLTDVRTHEIWENWLTYMDSTPPDLPEPVITPWR